MNDHKLGVLFVGLNGATANTTIVGSLANKMGLIKNRYGMLTEDDIFTGLELAQFDQLVFGGWDIYHHNAYNAAVRNKVLERELIDNLRDELEEISPWKSVITEHDVDYAKKANNILSVNSMEASVDLLKRDIVSFKERHNLDKAVVVYLASPLKQVKEKGYFYNLQWFREAIQRNDESISSAMLYAVAAIETGCPFVDFTPNVTLKIPAILQLAEKNRVPLAGRDGNTGQTLLKTVLGQMFKIRNLRLTGWYSTNILGNNDGLVLSLPEHRQTKMEDKLGVLEPVLGYNHFSHIVDIHYYPPRGDNKEAWESIDFSGWLDMPMSVKINWLGRDSILAAPLIIDLVRLMEFALRSGEYGIQSQLAIYFKHPLNAAARGFYDQYMLLQNYYAEMKRTVLDSTNDRCANMQPELLNAETGSEKEKYLLI